LFWEGTRKKRVGKRRGGRCKRNKAKKKKRTGGGLFKRANILGRKAHDHEDMRTGRDKKTTVRRRAKKRPLPTVERNGRDGGRIGETD